MTNYLCSIPEVLPRFRVHEVGIDVSEIPDLLMGLGIIILHAIVMMLYSVALRMLL